jgi:hypothetical protein
LTFPSSLSNLVWGVLGWVMASSTETHLVSTVSIDPMLFFLFHDMLACPHVL